MPFTPSSPLQDRKCHSEKADGKAASEHRHTRSPSHLPGHSDYGQPTSETPVATSKASIKSKLGAVCYKALAMS
jgi:hypothetical protein